MSLEPIYRCVFCWPKEITESPKLACEKCGLIMYCDQNCQNQDQKNHEELCSAFTNAKEELSKRPNDHDYCDKSSVHKIGKIAFNEGLKHENYLAFEKALEYFKDLEPDEFVYKDLLLTHLYLGNFEEAAKLTDLKGGMK